jgi:hypothetical protein
MSNQYKIFAYYIPDAIVYFNNKIKNYKKIDSQGKFKSVDWQGRIYELQHLIDELVSLYGNPPSNNLRFDSLVWCSDKALVTKDFTVNEVTDSLAKGIWYCLPVSGFDGRYFLSEESQDTLNNLREFGKLEDIVNGNNE